MRIVIFVAIALMFGVVGWITKIVWKRRLQRALGRKVSDYELTSISTWMKATTSTKRNTHGELK